MKLWKRELQRLANETGLEITDRNLYPRGVKVTAQEMQEVNITHDEFHGEWNYVISLNQQPP